MNLTPRNYSKNIVEFFFGGGKNGTLHINEAENINPTMFKHVTMDMPSPQNNGYFIANTGGRRRKNTDPSQILLQYLRKNSRKSGIFLWKKFNNGIIVKKKVDESRNYMDEWEEWVEFSNALLEEFESFFDNV